jgi:putative acetyltransferase
MIDSDGILHDGVGHPRVAGTYARVLGRYVRDAHALGLMDALRRMPLPPAHRRAQRVPVMRHKGRIRPGADADLVLFDPRAVADRATYREPMLPPVGIPYLLIIGAVAGRGARSARTFAPPSPSSRTSIWSDATMGIEITNFRREHAEQFAQLNREWLEAYGLMEPANEEQLADPRAYFLDRGGQIFVAVNDDNVIGTCAIVPHGVDEFEVAKLTVSPAFRGQGIARRLVERCLAYARERGARRVVLVSNSRLHTALRLYESFGFERRPAPGAKEYEHQDVYMELRFDTASP